MENTKRVIIDTCIMLELLKKQDKSVVYRVDPYAFHSCSIGEFKLFSNAVNSGNKQDMKNILQNFTILPFTSEVAHEAAEIYREFKRKNMQAEVRDIFTASAALIYDLPLLTSNKKIFGKIEGIRVVDVPA